ncbi:MAG: DegT/DnrJ/EryC1/StrS family aminotransferase [Candidatus Kapaibacterium sp.]
MNVPFVDLKAQYQTIKPEMDSAIEEIITNTAFIGGKAVRTFEDDFAAYLGVPHCVGVANGTEAIEIALRALGVGPGDEVIVPANTFIATSEAVTSAGATVVLADSDPDYYTLDPEDFRRKITSRTKAVIPVHLYGQPADMDAIMAIAREHNLLVIEDTSQAQGARYKGRRVGSMGDAGTFSFYPGKNLGAYGDAGAIVFRDAAATEFARTYAGHGSLVKYHHIMEGRNSRLDGLQAAVLTVKLRHLDDWSDARRRNAALYTELLTDVEGVTPPKVADYAEPVFHLYVIRLADRENVQNRLAERGISTAIHYPIAIPSLEAYRHLGHAASDFPVANGQMGEILSLPMYPELTPEMIRYTVAELREAVAASNLVGE